MGRAICNVAAPLSTLPANAMQLFVGMSSLLNIWPIISPPGIGMALIIAPTPESSRMTFTEATKSVDAAFGMAAIAALISPVGEGAVPESA